MAFVKQKQTIEECISLWRFQRINVERLSENYVGRREQFHLLKVGDSVAELRDYTYISAGSIWVVIAVAHLTRDRASTD